MEQQLHTIDEVAKYFNVSVSTIRNWMQAGTLPSETYVQLGRVYRFNIGLIKEKMFPNKAASVEVAPVEVAPVEVAPVETPPVQLELDFTAPAAAAAPATLDDDI